MPTPAELHAAAYLIKAWVATMAAFEQLAEKLSNLPPDEYEEQIDRLYRRLGLPQLSHLKLIAEERLIAGLKRDHADLATKLCDEGRDAMVLAALAMGSRL
jgi:hypothetical protein